MKVMTILGTRPEIIRLSRIIEKLDRLCTQVLVHTGQNYDVNLNDVFFQQLGVRAPDRYLGAKGSFGQQIAKILSEIEPIMLEEKPDGFHLWGHNSSLAPHDQSDWPFRFDTWRPATAADDAFPKKSIGASLITAIS
jgi:UDP-N-acetylglucosamine 2-epimerase (non-hydrolysing)